MSATADGNSSNSKAAKPPKAKRRRLPNANEAAAEKLVEGALENDFIVDERNNYLPSVKHQWMFQYRLFRRKGPTDSRQSGVFIYGPFAIGTTKWQLEWRIPAFDFYLRRVEGRRGIEHLSFRLAEIDGEINCSKQFTFSPEFQETRICFFHYASTQGKSAPIFTFEAMVRPENFMGGEPCDVRVVVLDKSDAEGKKEGKQIAEFDAHRSILAKRSPVFKTMLDPDYNFVEAQSGEIRIGNFSEGTVRSLLSFIYTGKRPDESCVYAEIEGKGESGEGEYAAVLELLDAAEQYLLHEQSSPHDAIKIDCGRRLLALIRSENAVELSAVATRYQLNGLKLAANEFIRNNLGEVVHLEANGDSEEEEKEKEEEWDELFIL